MAVSHVKGDFCHINDFTPSERTLNTIKEMNRVIDITNILEKILAGIPLFEIFAGRSANGSVVAGGIASMSSTTYNISMYDWELFADAVNSVGITRKRRLEDIADEAALYSTGKDYEFWRCVSNAIR